MRKLKMRLFLDAVLGVIIIAEMLIQVTGIFLHELLGFSLFLLVLLHLFLERKWVRAACCGARSHKLKRLNLAKTFVSLVLLIAFLFMVVSSLIISTILQKAGLPLVQINQSGFWTCIHSASAYAICMITIVHIALHWMMIFNCIKIPYSYERRYAIGVGVGVLSGVCIALLGSNAIESISRISKSYELLNGGDNEASQRPSGSDSSSENDSDSRVEPDDRSLESDNSPEGSPDIGPDSNPERRIEGSNPESTAPDSQGGTSANEDSGQANATDGICPLCPKRCPLSAPRCNKPYQAGLI
ncbi:MAG: DUF4405 domain-containing protein [Eggerthellaceae bacterium]